MEVYMRRIIITASTRKKLAVRKALIQKACFLFLPVAAVKTAKRNDPPVCTWGYNGGR